MSRGNLNDSELLHKAVCRGDLHQIKSFCDKFPLEKHFYNIKSESAVTTAILSKQFEAFDLLISCGVSLGAHEDLEEILKRFEASQRPSNESQKLREILRRHFKDPNLGHVTKLINSSKLSQNTLKENLREYLDKIVEAFRDLNEIKQIEPLLKVVASAEDLSIVFDFQRDSVDHMDPTKKNNIHGTAYWSEGYIYIGARGLLNLGTRCHVLGTLAHELCHQAMQLVYKNHCTPYRGCDLERRKHFERILAACEEFNETEPLIKEVYGLPSSHRHIELIVRVPHLLALYNDLDRSDRLMECESNFSDLFQFYEEIILVDLKRECPLMNARHEIKELNELCGVLSVLENSAISLSKALPLDLSSDGKFLNISSNCPQLTMLSIVDQFKTLERLNIFLKLEALKNDKIFDLVMKALALCTEPMAIVDCEGEKPGKVEEIARKFLGKKVEQKIIFITNKKLIPRALPPCAVHIEATHAFAELSTLSQEKFLKFRLNFQGIEMSIEDFQGSSHNVIQALPLNDMLTGKEIEVGQKVEFTEIEYYVERKFLQPNVKLFNFNKREYEVECSIDDVLNLAEQQKLVVLCDEPGMGKTTEFKTVARKLKAKFPTRWVLYVDLKKFVGAFEKNYKFGDRESVAKFLSSEVLKTKNFECKIFAEFFNNDRVILLTDGFDEISPSYKNFVMNLLMAIKEKSRNQLWISSRPHLANELKENLDHVVIKLKPFDAADQELFFERFLKSKQIDEDEIENGLLEIEKFLASLEQNSLSWDDGASFSNPLLMRMIVEIFDGDYSILLTESNYYTIYVKFVNKMIQKTMERGPEAENDFARFTTSSPNIFELHQRKAFGAILWSDDGEMVEKLESLCFDQTVKEPPVEQTVRVSLMYDNGSGGLQFIHRTFAEFFIADFIFKKIFLQRFNTCEELEEVFNFFVKLFKDSRDDYKMIKTFLDGALQSFVLEDFPGKTEHVREKFNTLIDQHECYDFFHKLVRDACVNLIKILPLHLMADDRKVYGSCLGQIWGKDSLLMTAIRCQPVHFIRKFWPVAREIFDPARLEELFLHTAENNSNVLHLSTSNEGLESFEFLVTEAKSLLSGGEFKAFLMSKDDLKRNILFYTIGNRNGNDFAKVVEILKFYLDDEDVKYMLNCLDDHGWTLLHKACGIYNSTSLEMFCLTMKTCLTPSEQQEIYLKATNDGETALTLAVESLEEGNVFEVLWSFLKEIFDEAMRKTILLQEDKDGATALHCATRNIKFGHFVDIKKFYDSILGLEKVKEIIFKENADGENILFYAVKSTSFEEKPIEALWSCMRELFDEDTLKIILQKRNKAGKTIFESVRKRCWRLGERLKVFMPFMEKFTEDEKRSIGFFTVLFYAAERFSDYSFTNLFSSYDETARVSFYRQLFMQRNELHENILHFAAKNQNMKILEYLKEMAKCSLSMEESKEILASNGDK